MVQRYFPKACHLSSGLVLESSHGFSVAFSNWLEEAVRSPLALLREAVALPADGARRGQ